MIGDLWMVKEGPFQFEGLLNVPMIWSYPGERAQLLSCRDR